MAIAIKRFVCDPVKYDSRKCCKTGSFEVFNHINLSVAKLPVYMVRAEDLDNPNIVAALAAKTDEEVRDCMTVYGIKG
jgi:hypothetical protein